LQRKIVCFDLSNPADLTDAIAQNDCVLVTAFNRPEFLPFRTRIGSAQAGAEEYGRRSYM